MTTNEKENYLAEHENRLKNAQPKYLTEGKKHYLLASSEESLQALKENQNAELTRVLISLKSEHDQITLESDKIQRQIEEYDKKIKMIQLADEASKAEDEQQKKQLKFMNEGIDAKKESTKSAYKTIINWINDSNVLKNNLMESLKIAKENNEKFKNDIERLILELDK